MSVSLIIVSIIILLIMFGAGQRIIDSLRLNDTWALIIMVCIAIGLVIPPIWIGQYFCFSIGGFLIPLALSIYLLISCGWSRDLVRAIVGSILWILPASPEGMVIDNMYIYGLVAGIVAYALGRSRRNAFVACLFGITLAQLAQWIINFALGTPSILGLGVGGAFSTYIVAIIISVAVSAFLGRCFETAAINKKNQEFNFETHTFDSDTNGKLNKNTHTAEARKADIKDAKKSATDYKTTFDGGKKKTVKKESAHEKV